MHLNIKTYQTLQSICVAELVSRSVKHLYKTYLQNVELMSLTAAISHFLNAFLGSFPNPQTHMAQDEVRRRHLYLHLLTRFDCYATYIYTC